MAREPVVYQLGARTSLMFSSTTSSTQFQGDSSTEIITQAKTPAWLMMDLTRSCLLKGKYVYLETWF